MVSAMTSPSDKLSLVRRFDCLWSRLGDQEMLFAINFDIKLRSKVDQKFQHKSENRVKMNICECVTLGRRVCFRSQDSMFVGSAFQFGFLQSKPWFPVIESSPEFWVHRGKPTLNWLFPRRWIKDWFHGRK